MSQQLGIFSYFAEIDADGSGLLDREEVRGLAKNFYGDSFEKLGDKVDKIFDIYDVDDSGELSYQEARCFLKGIQDFLEDDPDISEEQKEKIAKCLELGSIMCDDPEGELEKKAAKARSELSRLVKLEQNTLGPNGEILGPDGKPQLGADGKPIRVVDGIIVDENGNPVLGPDGKPLRFVAPGVVVDSNGSLMGPDGKPKLGPNGEALEIVDGLAVRADGVVLGNDGLPMLDEFGNPIRYINGQFVRSDGTVVNADGSVKLGEDGQPLKAEYIVKPCSNDKGELLGLDGKVILGKNGQPLKVIDGMVVDSDGNLYDAFGKPLLSSDGKELKLMDGMIMDPDGFCYDANGKPMLSCDGKQLRYSNGMFIDEDGMMYDSDGRPCVGPDGKQLRLVDGKVVDSNGNPLLRKDGGPLKFVNGKLVSEAMISDTTSSEAGASQARRCSTVSGFPPEVDLSSILGLAKLGADGKPMLGPNGELLDANGFPILGPNGELLGADGLPILGADGSPLSRTFSSVYESEEGAAKLAAMQDSFLRRCQEVSDSQESKSDISELDVIVHEPEIVITEPAKIVESVPQSIPKPKFDNIELDVEELMRRQKAGRSKSMIGVSPLDRLKKLTMREDVNDGFSKILGIYRPRPTITERPNTKDKWFRDPITLQWVSVEQVDALAISAA